MLDAKKQRFVDEYLVDLSPGAAAVRAGFSAGYGSQLIKIPEVAEAIQKALDRRAADTGIDAEWVLRKAVSLHELCLGAEDYAQANRSLEIIGRHVDVQAFNERSTVHHKGEVKVIERRIVAKRSDAD